VILGLVHERRLLDARALYRREQGRAERGLQRIDAVSQVATSIGLFGTVLGIAQSFFARGLDAGPAAPEVLSSGLSTALFTTIAGLVVFLFGQGFLIVFGEWRAFCDRDLDDRLEMEGER
jgi:biopolymer transport protein ExbB